MTPRERQIADALITERIVRMIEDGLPTPRERQVQRHLEVVEQIARDGLPGLPGGPAYEAPSVFTLPAGMRPADPHVFTFDGKPVQVDGDGRMTVDFKLDRGDTFMDRTRQMAAYRHAMGMFGGNGAPLTQITGLGA